MLKKMLSMLLAILMLMSISVTVVSADANKDIPYETATRDEAVSDASFDEAYNYLVSIIELTKDVDKNYYTEESYEIFETAAFDAQFAYINAYDDMFSAQVLREFADDLLKAYDALEALIFGDADGDKKVNIKDATEIQKHLADIVNLSEKRLLCADVNCDGLNNIKDATYIQKYVAGIIEPIENKFLHQELYVVDLKLQLQELIEYGREFTADKKFEAESFDRYINAESNAHAVFEDKEVVPSDIINAHTNLNLAIEELVFDVERISALAELYDALQSFPVGGNYTSESMGRLCDAIDEGWVIYNNSDATIEIIRQQTEKILDALDRLEVVHINADALNKLWEAIMRAEEEVADERDYTAESWEVFCEASYDARMTYYYGKSEEEYWIAAQMLNDAIDSLVIKLPEVLPTNGKIEFVNDYEFRVGTYNYDWENVNTIVRSPEELQAEIDKIDVNAYERNEDIFPEKYDDAFFEENAIIMSFCLVGGSGCSQWVYSLEIDGTALIVHRSINRPENYPPDMNYSLSYLEVKKSDIAGVTMIINKINGEFAGSSECR